MINRDGWQGVFWGFVLFLATLALALITSCNLRIEPAPDATTLLVQNATSNEFHIAVDRYEIGVATERHTCLPITIAQGIGPQTITVAQDGFEPTRPPPKHLRTRVGWYLNIEPESMYLIPRKVACEA